MQSGSSIILCALATRHLQQDFHTSVCTLKSAHRARKSFKGKGAPRIARELYTICTNTREISHPYSGYLGSPARKRLVPTLRPSARTGQYEVAPREQSKSREDGVRRGRDIQPRAAQGPLPKSGERYLSPGLRGFKRDGAGASRTEPRRLGSPRADLRFRRDGMPHKGMVASEAFNKSQASFRAEGRSRREDMPPRKASDKFKRSFVSPGSARDCTRNNAARRAFSDPPFVEIPRTHMPRIHGDGVYGTRPDRPQGHGAPALSPLPEEFETPSTEPLKTLPKWFTSPPLLEGLLQSVTDVLGADARPSPIQSLSLKHIFNPPSHIRTTEGQGTDTSIAPPTWSQYLLASETGSGKSMAYLLPMIQYLKLTENSPAPLPPSAPPPSHRPPPLNPRGLILAPTHELSRQLSSFAKALLHHVRLRVLCASRANTPSSSRGKSSTARQLKRELDDTEFGMADSAHMGAKEGRAVDVVVGTPMKVLDMVRGWGWDRKGKIEEQWDDARKERARTWIPGRPEAGLASIEWVVVDEADVLFGQL